MCEIQKKNRLTGESKVIRDKEIRSKFAELKKQFHNYKYTEVCTMTGEYFGISISSVRKIIEK